MAMTVPLDLGERRRRRIGPFWVEEGLGLVGFGLLLILAALLLYILAALHGT